jgi:hypothetical protein
MELMKSIIMMMTIVYRIDVKNKSKEGEGEREGERFLNKNYHNPDFDPNLSEIDHQVV